MRLLQLVALVTLAIVTLEAQGGHESALAAYRRELVALESHARGSSVEQLYERGLKVRDALLADAKGVTVLESLGVDDLAALKRQFTGFFLNRDEVIFVAPDPEYFTELARELGDAGDRAFFDAYRRTRPSGVWPAWLEQQTDSTGCTRFGSGELVNAYRLWSEYQRSYPRRYRTPVEQFLGAIEYEVGSSTCACGDQASVASELDAIEKTFPQTRVADTAHRRVAELRATPSSIRFRCVSGGGRPF